MRTDSLIIGGGAAGLMCAVAARLACPELQVMVLEKNERVGRKLLATGNGRCNIGNIGAIEQNYHSVCSDAAAFVRPALSRFSAASNAEFWQSLGLLITTDKEGRQYPFTNQASAVLDILRLQAQALGVPLITQAAVSSIERPRDEKGGSFIVCAGKRRFAAASLVLASGGLSSPQLSNAAGMWELYAGLGLPSSPCFPALTQIKTENSLPKAMKGLRIFCRLSMEEEGRILRSHEGELLFTEYGVSGIPAFELSRAVEEGFLRQPKMRQRLWINALPQLNRAELCELLLKRSREFEVSLEDFLTGLVNKRLGQQVLKRCGLTPLSRLSDSLSEEEILRLARGLQEISLAVLGTTGWQSSQVTAGGLALESFFPESLEARHIPGLFAIGEALDIDGDCGGYNLTWAWSSARLAAEQLARHKKHKSGI